MTQSPTKREAVLILRLLWKNRVKRKASSELARLGATVLSRGDVRSKLPASRGVVREVFTGRVDNISEGTAFVTLFSESHEQLIAQWPARELARKSIGKSDLFELTMTDLGEAIIPFIRRIPRQPIPDDLWSELRKLKESYSDLLTDEADGKGEER